MESMRLGEFEDSPNITYVIGLDFSSSFYSFVWCFLKAKYWSSTLQAFIHSTTDVHWAPDLCWVLVWGSNAQSLKLCPALRNPMDCSLPASSVHGIFQARILEWVAMPSFGGPSWPRDRELLCLMSPALAGGFFTTSTTWEAQKGKTL